MMLISSYDQFAEAWKTTLTDDQKNRISKTCLILAARLSFIKDDLQHRIFQDAEEFGVRSIGPRSTTYFIGKILHSARATPRSIMP
jgi:hypothetical protein